MDGRTPSSARAAQAALTRGWADEGVRPSDATLATRARKSHISAPPARPGPSLTLGVTTEAAIRSASIASA
jgi:hypothetical protein